MTVDSLCLESPEGAQPLAWNESMIRHAGIDASEKARQSFGIRFKTVREKRGLSQAEVATMLGLSSDNGQAYISKVEKGKRNLTLDTMIRLAAIVRVDVRDLLKPID